MLQYNHMLPTRVKCEVPECYRQLDAAVADRLKSAGKAAVCWDHRQYTVEDIKKMFGSSTSDEKEVKYDNL